MNRSVTKKFVSRTMKINGPKIHYTTGGCGPAVILLHGFAETSRMWIPILDELGKRFHYRIHVDQVTGRPAFPGTAEATAADYGTSA